MQKNIQNTVLAIVLVTTLVGIVSFLYIQKNSLKNEVVRVCRRQSDIYSCVKNESIKHKSVKPCYILNAGINDKCVEEVYQTIGDKMLCGDILESGIKANCEAYFSAK